MTKRIGVLVGMENDFPEAFCERVSRVPGFQGELVRLGGVRERPLFGYDVIIDRISHEVPFYRLALKAAALAGTYVINDPLWWSADDKFFGFSLAAKLGVATPRTVLLPSRSYIPDIDLHRSLRNLQYPLDWQGIVEYVGLPAILKPAEGGGWKNVYRIDSMDELIARYDETGQLVMTLQQFIHFEDYVRCLCIGREHINVVRYDPANRCYRPERGWLDPALERTIIDHAMLLNNALGYDMNSVEFAIENGVPYAIDFTNPAPDMYRQSILPENFEWCIDRMVDLVVKVANEGRTLTGNYNFSRYLPTK